VKKPPGQSPEHRPDPGGHLCAVGKLYDPSVCSWPERADYNFRGGGHKLRIFLANASRKEVEAVKRGRVAFGLLVDLPELFVVIRFLGPDERVVMSFDCSFQLH
jgi:hypothetical protein